MTHVFSYDALTDSASVSLDDLFEDAQAHTTRQEVKPKEPKPCKGPLPITPPAVTASSTYTDPAQWARIRTVALIDERTRVCLGIFVEYKHLSSGAKKFVRSEGVAPWFGMPEIEYNSGYKGPQAETRLHEVAQTIQGFHREVIADLTLFDALLTSPQVSLDVTCLDGAVTQIRLLSDTQFASPSSTELLTFPAGAEIREILDRESKKLVWSAIKPYV